MFHQSLIRFATATASGLILSLSLNQAQAAPVCKEIDTKSQCTLNNNCSWVNSYTTKKGNKVSAYCRKKGGSKKKSTGKKAKATKATKDQKNSKKSKPEKEKAKKSKKSKDKKSKNK